MKATEVKEGFAVETVEGLIFTVKGLIHPPDRWIAYLRYLPDPRGDRKRGDTIYRRVYRFEEQREVLRGRFPAYMGHDPVFGFEVQGVPRQYVRKVYDPRARLNEIVAGGARCELEEKVLAFAEVLRGASGVDQGSLGVSGSILTGLRRPGSDIDLVVYGDEASRAVHAALGRLLEGAQGDLRRLDASELAALHASHRVDTPLESSDFVRLQSRKVNEGTFSGIPYFMRFVKGLGEEGERYGDVCFESKGKAAIRFRVTDDRDAIFTPCTYGIEDVSFLDGAVEEDLREVVSFRGRFSDQVRAGEQATARGTVERVISRDGEVHHRLSVGGTAGDYLLSQG